MRPIHWQSQITPVHTSDSRLLRYPAESDKNSTGVVFPLTQATRTEWIRWLTGKSCLPCLKADQVVQGDTRPCWSYSLHSSESNRTYLRAPPGWSRKCCHLNWALNTFNYLAVSILMLRLQYTDILPLSVLYQRRYTKYEH